MCVGNAESAHPHERKRCHGNYEIQKAGKFAEPACRGMKGHRAERIHIAVHHGCDASMCLHARAYVQNFVEDSAGGVYSNMFSGLHNSISRLMSSILLTSTGGCADNGFRQCPGVETYYLGIALAVDLVRAGEWGTHHRHAEQARFGQCDAISFGA